MKKRKNPAVTFIVTVSFAVLILMLGLLLISPDKFFYCEQAVKYKFGRFALTEVSADDIKLRTVNADDMKIRCNMMLVNKAHPLDKDHSPVLSEYKDSGVIMSSASVDSFAELSADIFSGTGEKLYVMSSYRTHEEQSEIFEEMGSSTALPPYCSEHETGLAQDLYFENFSGEAITKCRAGRYLTGCAAKHGFILRYPPKKISVTGIGYEPWHFRYVGQPHAEIMNKYGLTLEDYIRGLEYGKFFEYGDYIISRQQGSELLIPEDSTVEVSSDNCGGYVITAKKK